ncbi:MAG: hypothetical protein JWM11_6 [Planctomycetaceae bacterium]|nr:hypothetical protein [Planctomycetaceae bacterium]
MASDNGDLSLRLRVKSTRIAAKDSIFVIAEIRNNRSGPVTILRPCGDYYSAVAGQIKIWNQDQQIKYTGPKYDYELTAEAFVTLEANKIVTDTLELPVRNFAGSDKAGAYLVRYDYTYSGDWDDTVAKKGVKGIWHGAMCSREVSLQKE